MTFLCSQAISLSTWDTSIVTSFRLPNDKDTRASEITRHQAGVVSIDALTYPSVNIGSGWNASQTAKC